jgi:diadenosine tetraphosphatase ApaH/serine/threonine PP2A family protein phosphatase
MQYGRQGAVVVKGNHDEAIEGGAPYMNETVRESIEWARKQLTSAQKAFLAALPLSVSDGELFFVHASAVNPQRWIYVDSPHEALRSLRATDAVYMFSGHVHDQLLFAEVDSRATQYTPISGSPIKVGPHRRWLGIVGSVGQPRDGRPSAAYAAFDLASRRLTFYRVPYDHEAAARKIRQAGLSESLAYRVERGV